MPDKCLADAHPAGTERCPEWPGRTDQHLKASPWTSSIFWELVINADCRASTEAETLGMGSRNPSHLWLSSPLLILQVILIHSEA